MPTVVKKKLSKEFKKNQGYWSKKAEEKGILTEKDLLKYLKKQKGILLDKTVIDV